MTEIGFYHLTQTKLAQALPRLLGRVLAQQGRAVVLCADDERRGALDTALWVAGDPDWLPHGTKASGNAAAQPIWLTTDDAPAPNAARFLFTIDGAASTHVDAYDRVFDLFDGADEQAVAAARERWRLAKAAGHTLTYWKQGARGWEKAA